MAALGETAYENVVCRSAAFSFCHILEKHSPMLDRDGSLAR